MTTRTVLLGGSVLLMLVACGELPAPPQAGSRVDTVFGGATPAPQVGDQRMLGSLSGPMAPTAESNPSGAELQMMMAVLSDLQLTSFAANAEHCGYLGIGPDGRLATTAINRGTEASCTLPNIPPGMTLVASFHTHGTYSPAYASEWPTTTDMLTDAQDGIDGYISTPGGRLWHVDTDTMTVRELCGRGCLPQDPRYRPEEDGPLRSILSLTDLQRYEAG